MNWLAVTIISLAGSFLPAFFLFAFFYELRTGKRFTGFRTGPDLTVRDLPPLAQAITLLFVLSSAVLTAAGIASLVQAAAR